MAKNRNRECSLPLWRELANPRHRPSSSEDRPSSVPDGSQRKIREHLENVATEWVKSASEPEDGEEEDMLPVFTRTQGQGYPAAWVGGGVSEEGSFEGVILCTDLLCLRKPLYVGSPGDEHWKQALVGLGNGDVIIYVRGDLPVKPGNESIEVDACRVEDRQEASSPDEKGVAEVGSSKARWAFFKILRKHPEIGKGLSSNGRNGRLFVADGEEAPDTEPCEGVVKKFLDEEGYGFIETESSEDNVFFCGGDTDGETFRAGDRVRFDLAETLRRPRALNLEVMERNKEEGIVDWFSEKRGYGFIQLPDDGLDDVFVHATDVKGGPLSEGDSVGFSIKTEDRGPKATNVEKIPE